MRNSLKLLFAFFWSRQASRIYCMKPGVSEKCNKSALVHVTRDIYIYIYIYIHIQVELRYERFMYRHSSDLRYIYLSRIIRRCGMIVINNSGNIDFCMNVIILRSPGVKGKKSGSGRHEAQLSLTILQSLSDKSRVSKEGNENAHAFSKLHFSMRLSRRRKNETTVGIAEWKTRKTLSKRRNPARKVVLTNVKQSGSRPSCRKR
jgi:hypothetical protein